MYHDLNTQRNKSLATALTVHIANVRLPKTSWKAVAQPWASSRETSVPKVAVGPSYDTSP